MSVAIGVTSEKESPVLRFIDASHKTSLKISLTDNCQGSWAFKLNCNVDVILDWAGFLARNFTDSDSFASLLSRAGNWNRLIESNGNGLLAIPAPTKTDSAANIYICTVGTKSLTVIAASESDAVQQILRSYDSMALAQEGTINDLGVWLKSVKKFSKIIAMPSLVPLSALANPLAWKSYLVSITPSK